MQPRIEPPPARGDEAELHSQLRRDLERVLARHVTASRDLIEDACQFAWLKLLDSHPERSSLFGWLYVVALHEAYRLLRIERRALHSSAVGRTSLLTSKIVGMNVIAEVAVTDVSAIEDLEQRWEQAWNDHDGDAVAALCAEDLVYDEPALGETVYGRDAIRDFVRRMGRAFPDYAFTLEGLYGDVSRRAVLVAWSFSGTHARTGRHIEFHGDDRLELGPSGLITAYRCIYDNDLVLRQLRHA